MAASHRRPAWLRPGRPVSTTDPSSEQIALELPDEQDEVVDLFDALENSNDEQDEHPAFAGDPIDQLRQTDVAFELALQRAPKLEITLRPYQEEAVVAWARNEGRGVVVLPTGAGKTVVAIGIAGRLGLRTLVVVPTLDLLGQWRAALAERLGYPLDEIGVIGGGKRTLRDVTVITYDSAAMPQRRLDGFGLLVVDEVHHLPARAYRAIAGKTQAPFRLGLSATPERRDDGHLDLDHLIGPVVFRRSPAELAREQYIANYAERRVFVSLSADEQVRYDQLMAEYKWYLASRRGALGRREGMFVEMIRRSGHDPAARSALRAHHQARMIALNADAKIAKVAELLEQHRRDKVIVFSEYNAMVDVLSERLMLPAITYRTSLPERRQILERFRSGAYAKLVTGRVLNEGVDVPDANVAIVVSGSSATREYIQRLGRVLRPKAEDAMLYELITRKTTEGRAARKRRPSNALELDGVTT